MSGKSKVEVRINGMDYTIVGSESDEYIQRVAFYVDKRMNEITRINTRLSTAMAAVLVSVNIADEYFKSMENLAASKEQYRQVHAELERLRQDNLKLAEENAFLKESNKELQFNVIKKETELNELLNPAERKVRPK